MGPTARIALQPKLPVLTLFAVSSDQSKRSPPAVAQASQCKIFRLAAQNWSKRPTFPAPPADQGAAKWFCPVASASREVWRTGDQTKPTTFS